MVIVNSLEMATQTETLPRWIHCNVCCATKNNKPFVMTSCGHLTCSDCADRSKPNIHIYTTTFLLYVEGPQTCCKCGSKCSKVHLKHPVGLIIDNLLYQHNIYGLLHNKSTIVPIPCLLTSAWTRYTHTPW